MRRRVPIAIFLIASCAIAAGCGGNKASRFYRLSATTDIPAVQDAAKKRSVVLLDPVLVPDYVKRAPIVVRVGESEMKVEEFHRWISDPERNIIEVLRENITRQCPDVAIALAPWVAPNEAALRIGVAIDVFELTAGEEAVMIARWGVSGGDRDWSRRKETRYSRPTGVDPKEKSYDGRVAALSALLADLSKEIAVVVNQRVAAGQ